MMRAAMFVWVAIGCLVAATNVQAQVVPIEFSGTFIGDLVTLEAAGQGHGQHLGNYTFEVFVNEEDGETYDVQTAADGSLLIFRRQSIEFEITVLDDGRLDVQGIDVWEVFGGTGRFANVKPAGGPIISTFWTPEPVDLLDPNPTPSRYVKVGEIDLGKRGKKK